MSVPEKPLTRREKYLAKAAGMAVTLPETDLTREERYLREIAEGGGGGGVTPEYVAEAIAEAKTDIEAEIPTKTSDLTNDSGYAAINDTTPAQNKTYSSAKVEEKVAGEEITTTATGTDLTLSTSSGNLNALAVYGKSEVVDGAIKSAGEGYGVVDLGTLTWEYSTTYQLFFTSLVSAPLIASQQGLPCFCPKYRSVYSDTWSGWQNFPNNSISCSCNYSTQTHLNLVIKDTDYTDPADFKTAMNGVLLCYQLADPTQGNTIAIKTDNGTGIDGTMATFTTGTPLRGIPDSNVRDVMVWNGSAGTAMKMCGEVDLGTLPWNYNDTRIAFNTPLSDISNGEIGKIKIVCGQYLVTDTVQATSDVPTKPNMSIFQQKDNKQIFIRNTAYTDPSAFQSAVSGVKLVYELATPTTEPLTQTENESIASLRTFTPQTHIQNNAQTEMTVEAYAGTANGKAVNELKQDVQSEISALKITQSGTLTLTTAGWTNNTQTVTYAHDTAKRNVIDVDTASVEEWADCGILATAETASGITFTCKVVPENALTFRVTSMGV